MDTSETLTGKRERAPVEGVMNSDIPTQSIETTGRLGDLHLVFATEKNWRKNMLKSGSRR